MKRIICLFVALSIGITEFIYAQPINVTVFLPDTATNIRSVAVVNDSTVWFGGSNGTWGYTINNGRDWKKGKTELEWQNTYFRSIAITTDSAVLMANIGSPGYILRTNDKGENWRKVYENDDKEQFFDALVFADELNGWALGDP